MSWLDLIWVQLWLWGLYALLPWLCLYRGRRGVTGLAQAMFAGILVQAVLGALWDHMGFGGARLQGLIYLGLWMGVLFACKGRWGDDRTPAERVAQDPRDASFMVLLLLASMLLRLIHPLQTLALGQSDAYSHLVMFREVVLQGRLSQAAYPPAYAWLMGMPCALGGIDPYVMARFGGAFWGGGLLLALHVLLIEAGVSRRERHLVLFCVGLFPAWNLIQKTAIGAFPNQAGLMLIPWWLAGFCGLLQPRGRGVTLRQAWRLFLPGLGFVLLVPMMFLHLVLISLFFVLPACVRFLLNHRRLALGLLVLGLLAGGVIGYWSGRIHSNFLTVHAAVLTTTDELAAKAAAATTSSARTVMIALVRDYISIKRLGVGTVTVDAAFLLLGCGFLALASHGRRGKYPCECLLALWGLVTLLQTATGMFQFSAYQREGWSLLLAAAVMGGWVGAQIWARLPKWDGLVYSAMSLAALLSIGWIPPGHVLSCSTAEHELVAIAHMLARDPPAAASIAAPSLPALEPLADTLREVWNRDEPLFLVTRPLLQEQLMPAVAGPVAQIRFSDREIWLKTSRKLSSCNQVLLLLDHAPPVSRSMPSAFAMVSPESASQFLAQQQRRYAFNAVLREHAQQMHAAGWHIRAIPLTANLDAIWMARPKELSR